MKITIRLHGVLTRVCAAESATLELPGHERPVTEVLQALSARFPGIEPHLSRTACAIGTDIVARDFCVPDGTELALIPPVSGG